MKYAKSYPFPFDCEIIKKDCLGKSGVYIIVNNITQDSYVGSAVSKTDRHNRLYIRFRNHFYNSSKSSNLLLRRALIKYGKHNFSFHILAFDSPELILNLESSYILELKPKYNILQSAKNSAGYKHTEEAKEIMRLGYSEERRRRIGDLNLNKKLSIETRALISEKMKMRHKAGEVNLDSFKQSGSKPTSVFDLHGNLLCQYRSAKEVLKHYPVDYRTIRRHLKNGEPIKKLGIIVKYNL